MLNLRLELLTGRYVASQYDDRTSAEWPPHPARVFSALVAAHHDGDGGEAGDGALRWLESLPPPTVYFSPLGPNGEGLRDVKTNFVPVNDKALTDAATVMNAWTKLGAATTDKARTKAETKLHGAYTKASAELTTPSKSAIDQARHILPDTRTKQPRFFPTVVPADPIVTYAWDVDASPERVEALREIGRHLVRVGHSSSLVSGWWNDETPSNEPCWIPDAKGDEVLRWVSPGQLDGLEALHQRAPYAEQRVMPYAVARYLDARPRPAVASSSFSSRFIVLRRDDGPRVGIRATERVAETVRQALMHHATDPMPSLISGHHGSEGGVEGDHLAVVPLPFVASGYARGDLLGVALIVPESVGEAALDGLYRAIASWEKASTETQGARLVMGSLGVWTLGRELLDSQLYNLRASTWTGPSAVWTTATPMVFDRHPGDLNDSRPGRRRAAHRKAHQIIEAAVARIGLPSPSSIELSATPWLEGSEHCRLFQPQKLKGRGQPDRRPRVHVRLRFEHPVQGPVLLGAGRFRGLGLFRPITAKEAGQ